MQVTLTPLLSEVCALCSTPVAAHSVQREELTFCCVGCLSVHQILETRKELDQGASHPLFEQAIKSGLISNPLLLEELRRQQHDPEIEWTRWYFEVENLWCPACAEVIRLILLQEKGIRKCVVDYATDVGVVEFAPRHISKESIKTRLKQLGYGLIEFEDGVERTFNKSLMVRLCVGAFCAMNIMMVSYPVYVGYFIHDLEGYSLVLAWIGCIASLPVIGYCGWPILQRFMSSMRIGYLGMEALIVLGVAAAFGLSLFHLSQDNPHVYFDSMSMIIVLVLVGKMVETKAKFSAKNTLLRLSRSLPRRCRRKVESTEEFVKVSEMNLNDRFVVLTGEKIPLDGLVVSGIGCCDESVMTGESLPVSKSEGSQVLAGTVLVQGHIEALVTRSANQTALSRIVEMVTHDLDRKKEEVPLVDRIVRSFVPIVVVIAILTALFNGILPAIAVLLIACPCALGIATPLADAETINGLAHLGAIVRSRRVLQWLGREDRYFFDKTGTITKGELRLIEGLGKVTASERCILKGLVTRSTHPLCVAAGREIMEAPIVLEHVEEVIGKGMRGHYEGSEYRFGSAGFTGFDLEGTLFTKDGELIAVLNFEDELRPEMVDLNLGVPATVLSGDRRSIVEKVAGECGFEWMAEMSPLQKREVIENEIRRGRIVGMVGDGINDAPALTMAQVSISVLSAAEISIQVSDLLLTNDNMRVIPQMRLWAQKGRRIIRQNLFWAFIYNIIGIGFAAFGMLSPIYATAAMIVSSLMVVINAQRMSRKVGREALPT